MSYFSKMEQPCQHMLYWLDLLRERGGDTERFQEEVLRSIARWTRRIQSEVEQTEREPSEPSTLEETRKLRPRGPRRLDMALSDSRLEDKILGAWLGRAAGCTLGIPPEGLTRAAIRNACKASGEKYPLKDYWKLDPKMLDPEWNHYNSTPRKEFFKGRLGFAGSDDDLAYTLIGLLILEEYGPDFSSEDVGEAWKKYLTIACTAEEVALKNLREGIGVDRCGVKDNPFRDWIGADIRSDPWGYAAPGWLEKAAEFAHRDSWISHRSAGIHGAMLYSAAIAAAFVVDDPLEAIQLGLTEIPRGCRVAKTVKQTLGWCHKDRCWDRTMDRIEKQYARMNMAHTLNNLAITVAGLFHGEKNFEKTITLTVMGGVDTDCNAATAGSLLGAILGAKRLPKKWIAPLGNRVETYLKGKEHFRSNDVARRFRRIARQVLGEV